MRMTRSTRAAALMAVATLAVGALAACGPGASSAGPAAAPGQQASTSAPSSAATPSSAPTSATPSPSSATPKAAEKKKDEKKKPSPTPTSKPVLAPGDTGDKVRELQSRLTQLDWFSGKITDTYGDTTKSAVAGFQGKRDLEATGVVDEKTWSSLTSMTRTPTDDEMHNRMTAGPALFKKGSEGEAVKKVQARLKQAGWFSGKITGYYGDETAAAVKGFQAKREIPVNGEVDQRTLDKLTGMTREPTKDELENTPPKKKKDVATPAGLDSRCMTGRALCISKSTSQMAWVVDGKVQSTFAVRFGSELTPTREGAFSVGWKSRDHVSTIYDTPMPYAMFFSGGQAVHYSADFAARGYNGASHGCVNVRDKAGIAALFNQVSVGDKVIVYR